MSEQTNETEEGSISFLFGDDSAFANLMDALAPEEDVEEVPGGGTPAAPDAGAAGRTAAVPAGAGSAGTTPSVEGAGAGGQQQVPPAGTVATDTGGTEPGAGSAAGDFIPSGPGVGDVDFYEIQSAFGEVSEALEESTTELFQATALEEVQKEFPNHFDAVNQHPRLLVGKEVPSINGEGMEVLRSSEDAKDWQEAMKTLLVREVQDRSQRAAEEDRGVLTTIHASIDLFQNNPDLVPGTKQFDKTLADRLMAIAGPYADRQDGKLIGFKIPLQPLVEQLRGTLKEERAAQKQAAVPAAASATVAPAKKGAVAAAAAPAAAAPSAAPAAQPQAGIPSQAGQSSEGEDFSTLFGTIGLPGFRI